MFSSSFVCKLAGLCKSCSIGFTKFGRKVAPLRPWKKLADFGNPDHVKVRITVG